MIILQSRPVIYRTHFGKKETRPSSLTKQRHASDVRGDDYSRYTAQNTVLPPASYHLFLKPEAQAEFWQLGQTLEEYLAGKRFIDIPFVQKRSKLGEEPFVVFDTETTGIASTDRILQLAAVSVAPKENKEDPLSGYRLDYEHAYNQRFHPGMTDQGMFPIHPKAQAVHGLGPEQLADQPTIDQQMGRIRHEVLKERALIVAYNAKFDVEKFNAALHNYNMDLKGSNKRLLERALVIDPYVLIQRIHPFCSQKKTLGTHSQILMGRPLENQHDALADVEATLDLLKYCLLYLEKHSLPKVWGEVVRKYLRERKIGKVAWDKLDKAQQAAAISTFVRHYRIPLEEKLGKPPTEPLRFVDILRFQHGSVVYHSDENLPRFDFNLNQFGIDGSKRWDGSDTLDPDLVERVRKERDLENREYLLKKFLDIKFPKPSLPQKLFPVWNQLLKQQLGPEVVDRFLQKTLPDLSQPTGLQALEISLKAWLVRQNSLSQSLLSLSTQQTLAALAASYACQQAKELQAQFRHRAFYRYTPIEDPKQLIDPAVARDKK